jgi:hypothetical protein
MRRAVLLVSLAIAGSCATDEESNDSAPLGCDVSTAQSGDTCQVNFFCDGAEGPAAYCSSDGACSCGPAVENPKQVMISGICDMGWEEAGRVVNERCDFGL